MAVAATAGVSVSEVRGARRGWWCWVSAAVVLSLGGAPRSPAQTSDASHPQVSPAQASLAQSSTRAPVTRLIIISGVSGEKRYADLYFAWASAVSSAATTRFGIPDSLVTVLSEDTTRAGLHVAARSTRENVLGAVANAVRASRPGDRLAILLFGHGNSQDDTPKLNLPGPDATAADFATALRGSDALSVLFVNTASASGDFVKNLSAPNRIVVTATRSAREQNETTFPQFFVGALTSTLGDTDKDGRVNILEAFTYARREVEKAFEQGNRIATEHAMLDDDGDGVAHGEASEKGPDGIRARAFFLEPLGGVSGVASTDPRAMRLVEERRVLEARIDSLRARRGSLSESDYQQALEPLMLDLAEKTRALKALEGKKP